MHKLRTSAFFLMVLAVFGWAATPAAAQSILRDAETEALLHDMATPLIKAAGLDPDNVDIVLVGDRSVNAFVAGGQAVYVNSGLIEEADTAAEVQGVIAHELGHVTGGHAVLNQGARSATSISLLSLLLGAAAAAAGGGEAAMGVIMAGQQAAMGKYLAYNRSQEASADAAGAKYLSEAGISGRGSVEFFKKLQNLEYRYGYRPKDGDEFYSTHPLTGDRIATLQDTYEKDPAWNKPDDPQLQKRFVRMKAKLFGYMAEPRDVFRKYPLTDNSIPAHYARAYAYNRESKIDEARAETDALVASDPDDPYFLELQGQILLESGHPAEAVEPLRRATRMTANQPLIATLFGHALMATEDPANFKEAESVLRAAVVRDRENPFAWYQLGTIYAANGDMPRARLASAEQQSLSGNMAAALMSAQAAEAGLPTGSPDWVRAQDIEMQARAELERRKKQR
ncbi:M48 family metalloprotease [Novosphingobium mangrovi (ex Huang et al. 2023)]|uniref:M48 family metalloprotease n=1 Tax=Novosphingobium mangrovi (ex Huang et al. 2023) TaxID=2976432 RepID=A0ABT2I9S4_9SPHN|nr:M48 family metalloprotease [Novosphingobium mangrovi (ex Huang et al. 2023)]MCT2401575.1 M48 family metalloprotease [Novosphingobium mangrovi (ex Huang et al. 2023)]